MTESKALPPASETAVGKWRGLGICVLVGLLIWISPVPEGVDRNGWQILAVFVATILSFILRPLPMAALVLLGLMVLILTKSFGGDSKASLQAALAGYSNAVTWLVVAAFLLSGAVIETGLGRRIALYLIHRLGRSPHGLAYGIGAAELCLGPFVPSNTARGGGILAPIVDSLCRTLARDNEKVRNSSVNQFLVLTGAHANLITAAMFLTGMAANPLVYQAARDVADVEFGWATWAMGSIVPGLCSLFLLPLFLARLVPPSGVDVSSAREEALRKLKEMGVISRREKILLGVFLLMLGLWVTAKWHGIHTTVVAMSGLVLLLLTGVQSWQNMARNHGAWDAMIWLGGLIMMAGSLKEFGVIGWFAENARAWVGGMSGFAAVLVLALIYFYSMYGFSMLTGHITAMVGLFLGVAVAVGAPPLLAVALLAYFSNLCGCLTNYSTGPMVIYFGMHYVETPRWLRVGFLMSLFHLAVWLGIGLIWWKILGWW